MNTVASSTPLKIAPLWRRGFARAIDLVCLAALVAGTLFVVHKLRVEYFPINEALVFALIIGYEVLLPAVTGGASIGRLAARIALRKEDGASKAALVQYTARAATRLAIFAIVAIFVAYEIDLPSFLFVCLVEALVCALRRSHQTLGDLVARTLVIEMPVRA